MRDFWILFLVKVHRWIGRKVRRQVGLSIAEKVKEQSARWN
jgi:hypothetical protein